VIAIVAETSMRPIRSAKTLVGVAVLIPLVWQICPPSESQPSLLETDGLFPVICHPERA
jgi:hypothetical protein